MADLEIFEMALETGAHVHIAHSSLARGFDIAADFRAGRARKTTGEACIQYLCMTEDDIVRLAGAANATRRSAPPPRCARMWDALLAGQDRLCLDRPRALAARAQALPPTSSPAAPG